MLLVRTILITGCVDNLDKAVQYDCIGNTVGNGHAEHTASTVGACSTDGHAHTELATIATVAIVTRNMIILVMGFCRKRCLRR